MLLIPEYLFECWSNILSVASFWQVLGENIPLVEMVPAVFSYRRDSVVELLSLKKVGQRVVKLAEKEFRFIL
jgi:hypothetical protein